MAQMHQIQPHVCPKPTKWTYSAFSRFR